MFRLPLDLYGHCRHRGARACGALAFAVVFLLPAGCRVFVSDVTTPQPIPMPVMVQGVHADPSEWNDVREFLAEVIGVPKVEDEKSAYDFSQTISEGIANNLTLAQASERVTATRAEVLRARAMVLPHLVVGATYRAHDGPVIDSSGFIFDRPIESLYLGNGAEARGAGTVTNPGIRVLAHLGDAVFEPRAMDHALARDGAAELAVGNQTILEIQLAYLNLATAQAILSAQRKAESEQNDLRVLVQNLAKVGQGREGDFHRVDTEMKLTQSALKKAEEDVAAARIQLARLIRYPDFESLEIADSLPTLPVTMGAEAPLDDLVDQALANRKEISALQQEVFFWETRARQERVRPFLPVVSLGFSSGWYSGSGVPTGNRFTSLDGRTDLDFALIWTGTNLGLGNHAMNDIACSRLRSAQLQLARERDQIMRQVVEAKTTAEARREELKTAIVRVKRSQDVYSRDTNRLKNLQVRPLEVLNGQVQLAQARLDLIQSISSYVSAKFNLAASIGGE